MSEDEKAPEEEPVDAEVVPEEDEAANTPPAPVAGGALVVQGSTQIIQASSPGETVALATEIANQLDHVIKGQDLRTKIGTKRIEVAQGDGSTKWETVPKWHVNVEGWQTLGTLLGVAVDVVWTRRVEGADGHPELVRYQVKETTKQFRDKQLVKETIREYMREGYSWEARAHAVRNGVVVGTGEAMCSRSEERWAEADDYAVRSMAQTRATARALKAAAGWIVSLAGYSATPAEEMDGVPRGGDDTPAPEEQQRQPTFGPKLNDRARGDVQAKLVALLADAAAAEKAWEALKKEAGGYMPRIVAKAIVILQTNAIPFGSDDDSPDPLKDEKGDEGDGPSELPEATKTEGAKNGD